MTLLVAGGDRVDAGKTTFTLGLVAAIDGVGFKPRAGNDYWFHHDDYQHAIDDGRLYGKDARKLAAAGRRDVEPEAINPVHRFWRPAPGGDGFIGPSHKRFVLDRAGGAYVVNERAEVPDSAREALPLEAATRVGTLEELNAVMREHHLPALEALAAEVRSTDRAVVESYGDVARPLQGIGIDRVAIVEPGRARIYDGDRYVNACEVATGSPGTGALEERVEDVIGPLDPIETVALPALSDAERADPEQVAAAYAAAYGAMR